MREYLVSRDERGQRLDKYLKRRLPAAPSSFIYKMLRKKNITLRGKKADGSEKVEEGDSIVLFLSDETIEKFSGPADSKDRGKNGREEERAFSEIQALLGIDPVLYEDEDILIVTKPAGVLSQKSSPDDISMNEWLRGYLSRKKDKSDPAIASGFRSSVCNRLDRNTGGILLCAKSLQGSRDLSAAIRDRLIRKTYRMVVHGRLTAPGLVEGDLIKDRLSNQVKTAAPGPPGTADFSEKKPVNRSGRDSKFKSGRQSAYNPDQRQGLSSGHYSEKHSGKDQNFENNNLVRRHAVTVYRPLHSGDRATVVEADLITGRSHQLRVHMASIGHPILFDPKYGDRELDHKLKSLIRRGKIQLEKLPGSDIGSESSQTKGNPAPWIVGQLLWCSEIEFPREIEDRENHEVLTRLRGRVFSSPEPAWWRTLC